MDTTKFDAVTRLFGSGMTRREALRGLVAGAAAVTVGGAVLTIEDASAKRRRKKKTRKNKKTQNQNTGQTLPPGERCEHDRQCTPDYICEVPVNGSNSDTYCCGAHGAGCGAEDENGDDTAPYCCVGHECVYNPGNGSWTCQYLPDEY